MALLVNLGASFVKPLGAVPTELPSAQVGHLLGDGMHLASTSTNPNAEDAATPPCRDWRTCVTRSRRLLLAGRVGSWSTRDAPSEYPRIVTAASSVTDRSASEAEKPKQGGKARA